MTTDNKKTTVITEKQAREITGGRKPLVPVEYESAVKDLLACVTLDEAKYWSDKADVLAAWAQMYRNDEAGIAARRLKLHAYDRMGALARELQPVRRRVTGGACALLERQGLSPNRARTALKISKVPRPIFHKHVEAAHGLGRTALDSRGLGRRGVVSSDAWVWLARQYAAGGPRLSSTMTALRGRNAKDVARSIRQDEAAAARKLVREIIDWLDEFEQYLPKAGDE